MELAALRRRYFRTKRLCLLHVRLGLAIDRNRRQPYRRTSYGRVFWSNDEAEFLRRPGKLPTISLSTFNSVVVTGAACIRRRVGYCSPSLSIWSTCPTTVYSPDRCPSSPIIQRSASCIATGGPSPRSVRALRLLHFAAALPRWSLTRKRQRFGGRQTTTMRLRSPIAVTLSLIPIGRSRVGVPPTAGPRGEWVLWLRGVASGTQSFPKREKWESAAFGKAAPGKPYSAENVKWSSSSLKVSIVTSGLIVVWAVASFSTAATAVGTQ